MVKSLREKTGAGIMDSKRALEEVDGDEAKAVDILREKGLASAAKRAGRATSEGVIESYIHSGGRVGALVQLSSETDFVARTDEFSELARELAMQVAAMNPKYVDRDSVPEDAGEVGDDELLMEQAYIRDPGQTVGDLVKVLAGKTGENVHVGRFARYELGE
jgi:elongation factor Ts|tara:strand:- start:276 stop:761 length:486 start_codon:yes stop_codon:yes gene_type:complete